MHEKSPSEKKRLTTTNNPYRGNDVNSLTDSFIGHLEYSLAKDEYSATVHDLFTSAALTARDRMVEKWIETQQSYYNSDAKRVYYLSLEFLIGRTLGNTLINKGIYENMKTAVEELGHDLSDLVEQEWDAGLGNGGLGRLAACFMDSLATLSLPAVGYGIRYEYGIFFQKIVNGFQVETPDNWLRLGNPWEIPRPEFLYPVRFNGRVNHYIDSSGTLRFEWIDTDEVMAMAYDTPVPGYQNDTVNNLRLWSAKSSRDFSLDYFNDGDYEKAVAEKSKTENISKVLYPNDNIFEGKELRLKQEYFFVSATIQDIIRRYKKSGRSLDQFHEKVAIQLNDTHPAVAIPELMRIFMDQEGLDWDRSWAICCRTFAYTNHTVLPEALERWPLSLFSYVLPRHIQIIYEINRRFLELVSSKFPGDTGRMARMSIIEEGSEKKVRMSNLAIVGSHSVNGVAAIHSELIKKTLFKDFFELWPEKFNNKTNGVTQRRWLKLCNPGLASLISSKTGEGWTTDLYELKKIEKFTADSAFRDEWNTIKRANKADFSNFVNAQCGVLLDPDSMFSSQIKRIHEYKRQLMNLIHLVSMYIQIKDNPGGNFVPRSVLFAGKAAPGYHTAKMIIKLINSVADEINKDSTVNKLLKACFVPNYSVSIAEKMIPATDLSEQISTAGTEASGTGNMKFALNGALTIGTLDGANVEIMEEVGEENMFIFGLRLEEVEALKRSGYNPLDYYNSNHDLKRALDMISSGAFSRDSRDYFKPLMDSLLYRGDQYLLLADFDSYSKAHSRVADTWKNRDRWTEMSILNCAGMGKFSSDRTISEYARDIWKSEPVFQKKG